MHTSCTNTLSYLPQAAWILALRILFFQHFALFHLSLPVTLRLQTAYYKINLHLSRKPCFPLSLPCSLSVFLPFLATHNGCLLLLAPPLSQPKQKLRPAYIFLWVTIFIFQGHTHTSVFHSSPLQSSLLNCIFVKRMSHEVALCVFHGCRSPSNHVSL